MVSKGDIFMGQIKYSGDYELVSSRRIALREGLSFYIYGNTLVPLQMEKDCRDATDEELSLWHMVVPNPLETYNITEKEVVSSFIYRNGPFVISTEDYDVVKKSDRYRPLSAPDHCLQGHFDNDFSENSEDNWIPVYISKHIPRGFFYAGLAYIKELCSENLDNDNICQFISDNLCLFT